MIAAAVDRGRNRPATRRELLRLAHENRGIRRRHAHAWTLSLHRDERDPETEQAYGRELWIVVHWGHEISSSVMRF
jgi:hypothetical protein